MRRFVEKICWKNLLRRFAEKICWKSDEKICWEDLLRRFAKEIYWENLLRTSAEKICWENLLRRFAEKICWQDLLKKICCENLLRRSFKKFAGKLDFFSKFLAFFLKGVFGRSTREITIGLFCARWMSETVVKCEFLKSPRDPFVTSCSSDVQTWATEMKWEICRSSSKPFCHFVQKADQPVCRVTKKLVYAIKIFVKLLKAVFSQWIVIPDIRKVASLNRRVWR